MSALFRKLLRDLLHMKGQVLAIALVVTAGISVFLASFSAADSLEISRAVYYEHYRFAHIFGRLQKAPNSIESLLAEIPGVSQTQTRVVTDISLDMEALPDPATAHVVSIPEVKAPQLNDLYIREGRWIEAGHDDEILLSESFALVHKLKPGDELRATINGRAKTLTIVGIALSPEYVYQIGAGSLWPDDKRFAVIWMGREAVAAALDMRGAFNDIALTIDKNASEKDLIAAVDHVLKPYGGFGAHGRADQISDKFLSSEFQQLRASAVYVPVIFLSVAAFLLNVVLSRLINTQRTQIATLKAFGYTNRQIGIHYLEMALVIVFIGTVLGVLSGLYLGDALTRLYTEYFRFPVLTLRIVPGTIFTSVGISLTAATISVVVAVRRAAALPPAEAMRPEPPATFHPTIFERIGLHRILSSPGRMVLRNTARRPARAILSIIGVSFATAILVLGRYTEDAVGAMADLQFRLSENETAIAAFIKPMPDSVRIDLEHIPGVWRTEPFRVVPVSLSNGSLQWRTTITGMPQHSQLKRLVDRSGNRLSPPPEGVALTSFLGKLLNLKLGDYVTVELLDQTRETYQVPVTMFVDELMGVQGYMEIGRLNAMLRESSLISGAYIKADSAREGELYDRLKRTPGVASVLSRGAVLQNFNETTERSMGSMRFMQIAFAVIIAFSIVYNNARIALAERSRELASLRVLGFSRHEVSAILLLELGLVVFLAIPLGLVLGHYGVLALTKGYELDIMRMPFVLNRSTYGYSAVVVLVAAACSALIVRRRIDHLDLVGVLKTRD